MISVVVRSTTRSRTPPADGPARVGLADDGDPYEIIYVDDGSRDNSLEC